MPVVMPVVMVVPIKRQGTAGAGAEQLAIGGCGADDLRRAFAADVAVQADHPVGGGHDDMQLVADHQHRTVQVAPDAVDQLIEACGTGLVEALRRLVQDQQLRVRQQRAGQQDALELAAGQIDHLAVGDLGHAGLVEGLSRRIIPHPPRQVEEAARGQRQGRVDGELLRHIAQPQTRRAGDGPAIGAQRADQDTQQGRLAGPVGADDGHDLARRDGQADVLQDVGAVPADTDAPC